MNAQAQLINEVRALLDENRVRCAWFLRQDFTPRTSGDIKIALEALAQRGDRKTHRRAMELMRQIPAF